MRSRIPSASFGVPPSTQSAFRVVAALAPPLACLLAIPFGRAFPLLAATIVAVLLVILPPASPRPRWLVWLWLALALVPLLALLPVEVTGVPEWRRVLVEDLGVGLSGVLSPDIYSLAAALVYYWTGLGYLWWACGQQWDHAESLAMGRMFLFVVAALAVTVVLWKVLLAVPLPGVLRGENAVLLTRNQLATILAMGCAGGVAVAATALRRESAIVVLGAAVFVLCFCALAALGSRAGFLVAVLGVTVALIVVGGMRRSLFLAALAGVLALAGLAFVVFGPGETATRIRATSDPLGDFRFAVQSDALDMLADQPLTGVGLGNFDGVFPFFRKASQNKFRAAHPESDLLWLANETGVVAVLLAFLAAAGMSLGWWRLARNSPDFLEPAAIAFASLAVVGAHGCLDVPGHSLLTWMMLTGLLAPAAAGHSTLITIRPSRLAPGIAAACLLAVALTGLLLNREQRPRPFGNDTPLDEIARVDEIEAWLSKHPLDAQIVEIRAHRLVADGRYDEARRVFALMERLTPFEPQFLGRSMHAWRRAGRPREFAETWVRMLSTLPPDDLDRRLPGLVAAARAWPEAAVEFSRLSPPLSWTLRKLPLDDEQRVRTLAGLSEVLALRGEHREACRIVIFQIAPLLGEQAPRIDFRRSWSGVEAVAAAPDRVDSWYHAGVKNFGALRDQQAWRIFRTYLAVHLPAEE